MATQTVSAKPTNTIATPHAAAATQTPSPWRRTVIIHPEVSEASSAPAEVAA